MSDQSDQTNRINRAVTSASRARHAIDAQRHVVEMRRAALSGIPGQFVGRPSRESQPELKPSGLLGRSGYRGILDEMLLHPTIGTKMAALAGELAALRWEVVARDPDSAEQVAFAELMSEQFLERTCSEHGEDGSDFGTVLSNALDVWVYGASFSNWTWYAGEADRPILEVYPILPSTIDRLWSADHGGYNWSSSTSSRWTHLQQRAPTGGVVIPRDRCITIRHQPRPGEWFGTAMTRHLIFSYEAWRSTANALLLEAATRSGVVTATGPDLDLSGEDWSTIAVQLIEWEQGKRRWLQLPSGYTIDMKFPSGTASGQIEELRYYDSAINAALMDSLASLGFADHGSLALGSEVSNEQHSARSKNLKILLKDLGLGLGRVIADRVGYEGPLPLLQPFDDRSRDVTQIVARVGEAKREGLVRWTPERELWLSELLDLPEVVGEDAEEAPPLLAGQLTGALEIVRQALSPDEGGRPLPPAVVRAMLRAAGLDADSAQEIVDAIAGASEPAPDDAPPAERTHVHHDGCGCGPERLGAQGIRVVDYDGAEFQASRELIGIETLVSWSANQAERLRLDGELQQDVAEIANAQRDAGWDTLPDTRDSRTLTAFDAVEELYVSQYAEAIVQFVSRLVAEVARQSAQERDRQGVSPGQAVSLETDRIREAISGRAEAMAREAAETMAARVHGEVHSAWSRGQDREAFTSRITTTGLAGEASGVGNLIEAEGRILEAVTVAPTSGVIPVEALRVEVLDLRLCSVCASRGAGGDQWVVDLTTAAGRAQLLTLSLPDPDCEGGEKCRCRWIIRYGRVEDLPADHELRQAA